MSKKVILFFLFLLMYGPLSADSTEELRVLNSKSKAKLISPETLDRILIDIKPFEEVPGADFVNDSILMDTYRNVGAGYAANFHFKQAYSAYRRYIDYKSIALTKQKAAAINSVLSSVSERELVDESQRRDLQIKLSHLEKEKDAQESRLFSWKRNISMLLILLSSVFAILLVSSGIRLFSRRSKVRQNRERMKEIHRSAGIGNLEPGLSKSFRRAIPAIREASLEIQNEMDRNRSEIPSSEKEKQIFKNIEKILKEV